MQGFQIVRGFSSTAANNGKRFFKKFNLYELRGPKQFRKELKEGKFPEFEYKLSRGVQEPHLQKDGQEYIPDVKKSKDKWGSISFPEHWEVKPNENPNKPLITNAVWEWDSFAAYEKDYIPEMIPDLIVPDLEGFQLKPYVSYKAPDVETKEFTPQDLFHAVYTSKIIDDFKENRINEDGSSTEPSSEESLHEEEAKLRAQQTGSDYI
uniref:39S ribosomal protein L41, mitochondrial-like n=2 Tax=Hirondellea gigas TaxID=1518452 RepID=A0A2P2I0Q5_9CRUS